MFCMMISCCCVSLMFTVTIVFFFFFFCRDELWKDDLAILITPHARTHTHTSKWTSLRRACINALFHTCDSLTVVKDGCIDQILLFKKEKSGIGLCAEIFMPAVWELCECSFFFWGGGCYLTKVHISCDDFSITVNWIVHVSQRNVNRTRGQLLCWIQPVIKT